MLGKRHLLTVFLCAVASVFAGGAQLDFFYEPGCSECEEIESRIFPKLGSRFEIVYRDIGVESNLVYLLKLEYQAGYSGPGRAYLVLNGQYVFGNPLDDPDVFFQQIESWGNLGRAEASPPAGTEPATSQDAAAAENPVRTRFEQMTLPMVLVAGLLDGINPCVVSTLIFFMSLLAVSKIQSRRLLVMGISFCLASFLTYLAIGLGLLRFLHLFSGFTVLRTAIEWVLIAVLLVFSFLSFRDAFCFRKSGEAKDVMLQVSVGTKMKIHAVMRRGLKTGHLVLGGLMIGALVTALESVCTGQVYVPTLVLILKDGAPDDFRAWGYLIAYNLLFILPLVIVFVAAYFGLRTEALLEWSCKNVVFSKTLLGLFFAFMALLIFYI